jgi:alcohol dehydrogenase class IV
MKFNASATRDYADISRSLFKEVSADSDENATAFFIRKIDGVLAALKLNKKLRDLGVRDHQVEELAKAAFSQERLNLNNPRKIKLEDALAIYQDAF